MPEIQLLNFDMNITITTKNREHLQEVYHQLDDYYNKTTERK